MRYHIQYNIKSHTAKYICVNHYNHPKYTTRVTKAHHDAMNRIRTQVWQLSKNTCSYSKIVHRPQCLKEILGARESHPRLATRRSFHHPDDH